MGCVIKRLLGLTGDRQTVQLVNAILVLTGNPQTVQLVNAMLGLTDDRQTVQLVNAMLGLTGDPQTDQVVNATTTYIHIPLPFILQISNGGFFLTCVQVEGTRPPVQPSTKQRTK